MIVTLAGHVDHGKTTLVRLLTGTDTDRLAEEKRRGLTIDLGFAYLRAGDTSIGFVDVPGHHRFIHNMVAGVAALQHALLVVAADDGPMPQSREHLQILELLGIGHGVVALTKCDRVPPGRIDAARAEVKQLLAGTFLERAPLIETAATGAGIERLRAHLLAAAQRHAPAVAPRRFRMPVDRAFTLKGAGLVATGTVHAGRIAVGDEVYLFPSGERGRVRDLRVQDGPAGAAGPGDRAALNLAGVDAAGLARGHWLCAGPERGHHSLVLDFRTLPDFPREIRHFVPVHAYHATSHTTARLALLDSNRLAPGCAARVELVLEAPLAAKRGDRLVVRDQGLERTLGGGTVLDNRPTAGRRRAPSRLAAIDACARVSPDAALAAMLELGPVNVDGFQGLWDLEPAELDRVVRGVDAVKREGSLVASGVWQRWRTALLEDCLTRHRGDPTLQGLRENELDATVPARFRNHLLEELVAADALERRAGRYLPRRHEVTLSDAERALLESLAPRLDRMQPPSLGDLAREVRMPLPSLKQGVQALASKGVLVQISDKRIYLPWQVAALADTAEALAAQGPFSAAQYRDAAGIGRNVAIDVLEYFDARGYTRRHGETRIVTGDRSRLGLLAG